jgi:hypothetical protein
MKLGLVGVPYAYMWFKENFTLGRYQIIGLREGTETLPSSEGF